MSSTQQDKSIPQQRAEMQPRCRLEGVEVVREFVDSGISGGGMRKRDDFQAMLTFCQKQQDAGTPIAVIACYDTSRFSRADSNETAAYIWQFRQAGTNRLLTRERWYDFRKAEDRTMFNIGQDFGNNDFLKKLSANVLRGRKNAAAAGYFSGGSIPYGFQTCDAEDDRKLLVPFPDDDPDPAHQQARQTLLWLFSTFAEKTVSYRWLAEQLNTRGVPSPRGGVWNVPGIKRILTNPVYAGTQRFGAVGAGQYHRFRAGESVAVEPDLPRVQNGDGALLVPLEAGGYITRQLWDTVQERTRERFSNKMKPRAGHYVLPGGILHCGHCGGRMYGATTTQRRGEKSYRYVVYTCSSPNVRPGLCRHYSVKESVVVDLLRQQLLTAYLSPERLKGLEDALTRRAGAKQTRAPGEAERLRGRLGKLEKAIVAARRRTLLAEDDATFAELNEGLRELLAERERLQKQLSSAEATAEAPDGEGVARVERAMGRVRELRETLEQATGRQLGEVLRHLISRADLYFEEQHKGKRKWYSFVKGVIKVRPLLSVPGFETDDR
jgi:site-specific DNA recombinase